MSCIGFAANEIPNWLKEQGYTPDHHGAWNLVVAHEKCTNPKLTQKKVKAVLDWLQSNGTNVTQIRDYVYDLWDGYI